MSETAGKPGKSKVKRSRKALNLSIRACPGRAGQRLTATLVRVKPYSNSRPAPMTPDALRMEQALQLSAPLARLRERMRDSNDRFEAIRSSLPVAMAAHVKPGPVDELGWSLLAANAAVAAKLRQLQPRLEEIVREKGWPVSAIRVKVESR